MDPPSCSVLWVRSRIQHRMKDSSPVEYGNPGKDLPFQVFERSAAPGETCVTGSFSPSFSRAATESLLRQNRTASASATAMATSRVPRRRGHLEDPHGTVPDDGLGLPDHLAEPAAGVGPMSRAIHPSGYLGAGHGHAVSASSLISCATTTSSGRSISTDRAPGLLQDRHGFAALVLFHPRGARRVALGLEKGVGHAAADEQSVHLAAAGSPRRSCPRPWPRRASPRRAGRDPSPRSPGSRSPSSSGTRPPPPQEVDHPHVEAWARWAAPKASFTYTSAEGPGRRKARVVLGLFLVVAEVLQQENSPPASGSDGRLDRAGRCSRPRSSRATEQLRKPLRHRGEAHLGNTLSLGPAEMGGKDHLGPPVLRAADGGQEPPESGCRRSPLPWSSRGTLKSTRMKTRFPVRSSSSTSRMATWRASHPRAYPRGPWRADRQSGRSCGRKSRTRCRTRRAP